MYSKIGFTGILLLAVLVSGVAAVDNMIDNPDFEKGTMGWLLSNSDDIGFAIDPSVPGIVGNAALARIGSVGTNPWQPELHSAPFSLENGKTYTYAFYAKTEAGKTRPLGPRFEQFNTWVSIGEDIEVTDEWVEYHYTGVWEHPTSPPYVELHIAFNLRLEDVWFSHFRAYEGEYVGEKLASVTPVDRLTTAWGHIKTR